jgi:YHS domain-containing protein
MKFLFTFFVISIFSLGANAQSSSDAPVFYQDKGIAIKGYDPVAYFTEKKAMPGDQAIAYEWAGTKWQFISKDNMELFKKNPEKYAPQYGGFCAYGVSENHKSPTDPNAWTVVGDKLYLNYNLKVKELWSTDVPGRIKKADTNWKTLEKEKN